MSYKWKPRASQRVVPQQPIPNSSAPTPSTTSTPPASVAPSGGVAKKGTRKLRQLINTAMHWYFLIFDHSSYLMKVNHRETDEGLKNALFSFHVNACDRVACIWGGFCCLSAFFWHPYLSIFCVHPPLPLPSRFDISDHRDEEMRVSFASCGEACDKGGFQGVASNLVPWWFSVDGQRVVKRRWTGFCISHYHFWWWWLWFFFLNSCCDVGASMYSLCFFFISALRCT